VLNRDDELNLQWKGHKLKKLNSDYGNMQLIIWNQKTNEMDVASDLRGIGEAKVIDIDN
jgi:gamma-glutamyltranspeptidase/glutathione hydrolase